jgi:hypothetical protein
MTDSSTGNAVPLRRALFVSCIALLLLAPPALAQDQTAPSSSTQISSSPPPPDFLLGRPRAMVGMRGGWFLASANSDFFDDMTRFLTLEKSSFRTATFSPELAVSLTPHLDIVAGLDINKLNRPSEDREFNERLANGTEVPIQQTTELSEMNLAVSAKFSLVSRGRRVSRLAWIPRTFVPYVGAGAGYGRYTLRQNGDFADYGDLNFVGDETVFSDTFRSEGWAPLFHAFGGTDIQVMRRLVLSFEGRYTWKKADLSSDYIGYEPIDLGGLRFGAGIHFAF